MIAHVGILPVEELLPLAFAGGSGLWALACARLRRRGAGLTPIAPRSTWDSPSLS